MKTRTNPLVSMALVVIVCVFAVAACPVGAKAEKPEERVSALETRVRELEARMAKAETRLGEHEQHQRGYGPQAGGMGTHPNMPDQPMGMPPQHTMPTQTDPQPAAPMGGAGMSDM
jgi:hypothetical protein